MIPFSKLEGLGNDYVLIDGAACVIDDPASLARVMSDRHFGIGADGIILVLPAAPAVEADVRMRMFNADGSEAEMCGNGIRCLCKFVHDRGQCRARPMRVQTLAGVLSLDYATDANGRVDRVTVDMGRPRLRPEEIPVRLPGPAARVVDVPLADCLGAPLEGAAIEEAALEDSLTCVSMGNPHAIIGCGRVDAVPLASIGPALERAPLFPNRINVHFVEEQGDGAVRMRTWERGAGATLACGTGAAAVCVAGVLRGRTRRDLLAHLPGGDLELCWDEATGRVFMTGPAREVFRGEW